MSTPNVENYTLGRGSLFWADWDEATQTYSGERHLGNAPEVTLSTNVTNLDHFSSMAGLKAKDKTAVSQISPQIGFTLEEFESENWKLLVYGTSEPVVQAAEEGLTVTIPTPELGRYYELGKLSIQGNRLPVTTITGTFVTGETVTGGTSAATAVISAVGADYLILITVTGTFQAGETITGSTSAATTTAVTAPVVASGVVSAMSGSTTLAPTTDYVVDGRTGRVFFPETSTVAADVVFTFSCAAAKYTRIRGLTSLSRTGKLRFISDNPDGGNFELVAWKCQVSPNGDTGLISDEWANMQLQADVLRDTNHPDSPYLDLKIYD